MVVSSFAIGLLAKAVFYLGFVDAILVVLFFNLIGILPVCYFSTFGPRFGLRQMVLSRFWFGWWGVKLIACFNVLACVGWSSVNSIVGAQLINAVNNDVNGAVGIVIIAICTLFVTLFGYKVVHTYEFWSWLPTTIIFFIVLGTFAHTGDFQNIPMGVGTSEMGSVFSFGAVVYGYATGWTSYAADYTVYQPSSQSRMRVFWATWAGLIVPLLFTEMLGVAIMSATSINGGDNIYQTGYNQSGTGGILGAVLFPHLGNFGKFCLVVLALSIIANNCPNLYSVSLTMQVLGRWTQRVPRFVWTFIATCVYIAIAIPGYSHFELVLQDFMNFIGYWLGTLKLLASDTRTMLTSACSHLRGNRPDRSLRVQARHARLQPGVLRPPQEPAARHRSRRRVLLWYRRHGDGHEPAMVGRSHRAEGRRGSVRRRCRLRAWFRVCCVLIFRPEEH